MQFAQTLNAATVSEWKAQYLDYKLGKEKLKNLKELEANDHSTERHPNISNDEESIKDINNINASTPLLSSRPGRTRYVKADSSHASNQYHSFSRKQQSFRNTEGGNHSQYRASFSIDSANTSPHPSAYEIGKSDFLKWLDSEFIKIEQFYKSKEEYRYSRFLLLQDQLSQLKKQKNEIVEINKQQKQSSNISLTDLAIQTKERISHINKFELPSLPRFEFLKNKTKNQKNTENDLNYTENQIRNGLQQINYPNTQNQYISNNQIPYNPKANKRDYEQRSKVSLHTAQRQLKAALLEYYRSLELLKSYRTLNKTAFRKMIKKFDKSTHSNKLPDFMYGLNHSYFATSDLLDNLFLKIEDLYSVFFEDGNKKLTIEKLRSKSNIVETFYESFFVSGILMGMSLPLMISAIHTGLHKTISGEIPEGRYILQIWSGALLVTLMSLLFGINCFIFDKFKINYKFIFEFNIKSSLDYKQFFLLPSISLFLISLIGWFSFDDFWSHVLPGRNWPLVYVSIMTIIFLWPGDMLYLHSRRWLQIAIWRLLLSGFYPVEFRDFFLGDIFASLTYSMSNISFFICIYATRWKDVLNSDIPISKCGSSRSRVFGFLGSLPSIWRFLQCFRRYADTGDWFPHLANMLKFSISAIYYGFLSVYRIDRSSENRVIFICIATINSIYSGSWDILMDWSLFQTNSENKYLRNDLVFEEKKIYYFGIICDILLRFQWIFYVFFKDQLRQSAITSFFIAIAEIIRRFIWIFFRMENEHCTNVNLFRASRETDLPYPISHIKSSRRDNTAVRVSPAPMNDEESGIGITESTMHQRSQPHTEATQVIDNVSKVLNSAHIKDFQRRNVPIDEYVDSDEDGDISDTY